MESDKKQLCLKISMLCAKFGKLNLTDTQLSCLYRECFHMAGEIGDILTQMLSCRELGVIAFEHLQFNEAIKYLELQIYFAKQLGEKVSEGDANCTLGGCYCSLGEYDKAVQYHQISLDIAKQVGDKSAEGGSYGNLGNCYQHLGHYHKAIQQYEMHLKIAKEIGDKSDEKRAYGKLGECYCSLTQYDKAIHYHEMSLNIAKQIGDKADEENIHRNIGKCYQALAKFDKAVDHHEMSLNIAKKIGDKPAEEGAYSNLGSCYHSLGQYDKAIHLNEMSLNIASQIGEKAGEGNAHGRLGICYCSLGEYDKAIYHQEVCLNIKGQIEDRAGEGCAYGHLGICYRSLGQYDKAIQNLEICVNIAKQIEDKANEGRAYGNLGNCCYSLGQYDKAIQLHEMNLKVAKQIGDKVDEGRVYGNLGNCYRSLGQYDKAIQNHEMSLNIAKQIGDKASEGVAYGNLGNCYRPLGQYDKAVHCHEMNLDIAKQILNKAGEGICYSSLGICYNCLGKNDKARHYLEMSLDIAKQTGDKECETIVYTSLGSCYISLKQFEKAEKSLKDSLRCSEDLFQNVPKQDPLRITFRDIFMKDYPQLTSVLLLQNKAEEALVVAERGRARALAELLLTSYSAQCTTEVTEAKVLSLCDVCDVVKEMNCSVLFFCIDTNSICVWVIQPNGEVEFKQSRVGISTETNKCNLQPNPAEFVEEKLKSLIRRVRKIHGQSFTANCVEDRSLSFLYPEEVIEKTEIKVVSDVALNDAAALEMDISGSPVCASCSSTTESVESHKTTFPASTQKTEQRNIEELTERDSIENNPLQELYQLVLNPVRQFLKGPDVVVVADGALNLVPFAALMDDDGCYVAESLQVRLIPSLATAKMIIERPQEPGGQASPLILGDPGTNLPGAYKEAVMIGRLFGVQPLTRKDATKENFLRNVENANLIHIAAHGDMKRGEILLASKIGIESSKKEDYMLMMSDLEKKCLKAKLVVLSCCHSARGEVKAEGVIGIARAFIGAGASAVLVALWAIDDDATLYFMQKFYEHLVRGEKASESLDKAMRHMRDNTRFCSYRLWAPFVLIGDNVSLF